MMKDMWLGNDDDGNDDDGNDDTDNDVDGNYEDFNTCWPRRRQPPEPSGLLTMSRSVGLQENPPPQEVNICKGNSFQAG